MQSIRDGISPDSLANLVRLLRKNHKGSFLLVEGSGDKKFFTPFLDSSNCMVVVCSGRPNLLGAVSQLFRRGVCGVLGFADRDFSNVTEYPYYEGEVVFTDENDLEMMLLCSGALEKILSEYGRSDGSQSIADMGIAMRYTIFHSARVLGMLRLLSIEHSWCLRFEGMKYKYENTKSCSLDLRETIRYVVARTNESIGLSNDEVAKLVLERLSSNLTAREICCGHDSVRILGRALKAQPGAANKFDSDTGAIELEEALRLAYESIQFKSTECYSQIRRWEQRSGFKILQ